MESLKRHFTQMTKNTDGGKKAQSLKPTGPCFLVESYYIRYNPFFLCKRFWDTENRDYFFSRNEKSQLLITQSKLDDAFRETDISKHGQKPPKTTRYD